MKCLISATVLYYLFYVQHVFCLLRPLVKGVTASTAYVGTGRTVEV